MITEEPKPGWIRYEIVGQPPWFKTPVPRKIIRNAKKLKEFLEQEHRMGRMLDVEVSDFSFKRRLGLKRNEPCSVSSPNVDERSESGVGGTANEAVTLYPSKSIVERLSKNSEPLDHKKLLLNSAKKVDMFQQKDEFATPQNFEEIKEVLSSSGDMRKVFKSVYQLTRITHLNCNFCRFSFYF